MKILLFSTPAMNDAGQVMFGADLSLPNAAQSTDHAIFIADADSVRPIVRPGMAVPGIGADVQVRRGFSFTLAPNGKFTYWARVTGSGIDESNDEVLFVGDQANPQMVAREGSPVQGLAPGIRYRHFSLVTSESLTSRL